MKFIIFMDRIFPWIMIIVACFAMIYLVVSGINDKLDANRTCSEINSESHSSIISIKEKRFIVCGSHQPTLREIK